MKERKRREKRRGEKEREGKRNVRWDGRKGRERKGEGEGDR